MGIIVKGIDNCLVRLSRCCYPVPGDEIIGYITRGRGVSVHTKDCINIKQPEDDENRLIEVEWETSGNESYLSEIQILANDHAGLLVGVTNKISEEEISLKGMNARTTKENTAIINLILEIVNTEQLERIIKKLSSIKGVFEVNRTRQ